MAVNKNSVVNIAGYKFEPLDDAIDLIPIYQQKCDDLLLKGCLLYTSPSPRDRTRSRMPSSA